MVSTMMVFWRNFEGWRPPICNSLSFRFSTLKVLTRLKSEPILHSYMRTFSNC